MAASPAGSGGTGMLLRGQQGHVAIEESDTQELVSTPPTHRGIEGNELSERGGQESEAGGEDMRPWGRLVAINNPFGNIMLKGGETTIGRADAGNDFSISKHHCRLLKDLHTDVVHIEDLSKNGTYVNGSLIGKGSRAVLHPGDEVCLVSSTNELPSYVFQLLTKVKYGASSKKRPRVNVTDSLAGAEGRVAEKSESNGAHASNGAAKEESDVTGPQQKKGVASVGDESMKCDICHEVWHDCVSAGPCSHNFWSSCLVAVCALAGLVEEFLKAREDLRRPKEDLAELDKLSLIRNDYVTVKDLRKQANVRDPEVNVRDSDSSDLGSSPGSPSFSDFSSSSVEEIPAPCRCRHCEPVWPGREDSEGRFICSAHTLHVTCGGCGQLMPIRQVEGVHCKCMQCNTFFCDNYWRSQGIPSPLGAPGCELEVEIKELRDWEPAGELHHAFGGNQIEAQILEDYLTTHNISRQALWQTCLAKMDAGEMGLPDPSSSAAARGSEVNSRIPVCQGCVPLIWRELVYKYRAAIPNSELPPEVVAKVNCWYGRECRTQHRSEEHARRLNHVGPNTRADPQSAFAPFTLRAPRIHGFALDAPSYVYWASAESTEEPVEADEDILHLAVGYSEQVTDHSFEVMADKSRCQMFRILASIERSMVVRTLKLCCVSSGDSSKLWLWQKETCGCGANDACMHAFSARTCELELPLRQRTVLQAKVVSQRQESHPTVKSHVPQVKSHDSQTQAANENSRKYQALIF
ncbi:hypothetical protein CBR_g38543 [Chara braunii]|uniref:RING-type E3 ubiquitin transferase n=1 Tax=Chara braunii TaxID=69332 RepID=A0A388JNX0_CHABU|nr:hypothetical protein CBR_g38543 [Chara braunii]|eukprot:GBG59520.1 hypothetical protein CBR_g38543 [Chara braunii]